MRLAGGFGDIGHKTPMKAGDHYKIASLTKTYTAAVVLQLVAEGKLRLTDSIERWVPGLVPNGEQDHDPPAAEPHERARRVRHRTRAT